MSCDCPNCKRDNILNGTLVADCAICSTRLDINTKFQIMPDKTLVCDTCVAEHFVFCKSCNKLHKKGAGKTVFYMMPDSTPSKAEVCERCFTNNYRECAECHNYYNRHELLGHGQLTYCRPCFNKSYQQCANCQQVHPKGTSTKKIRGDVTVCDSCFNQIGPIDVYETKPKLQFHGLPPHYYGIELECELANAKREQRGAKAQETLDLFQKHFVVLKDDGSLKCGFEVCSQPASAMEHKRLWSPFFDKLPANIVSFNTSNCGLHIHCSKQPLSLLTIAKIVVFVNDDKNQPFVELIAGRTANTYATYQKKGHVEALRNNNTGGRGSTRYEAVNLINKDTIEFRIFKGTLKRELFYKAIEFCDALIKFCSTAVHGITYCRNKENFIDFVVKKQKEYPHLYAFICAKIFKTENKLTKAFGFTVEGAPNKSAAEAVTNNGSYVAQSIATINSEENDD